MKKIKSAFIFFFAWYMLSMVFIPCADICAEDLHEVVSSMNSAQEHHQEHSDLCSPFCSCSCCSSQITFAHFQSLEIIKNDYVRSFVSLNQVFLPSIYFSIWQPPKLAL
ncbi:MAG: hypothetical protein JNL49_05345 [Bacteroidia bacterium]|nr:hypothetical protein [Bacteroidia bacterium]